MSSFLIGIFVGASLVGSSVQRTLSVGKGNVLRACVHNGANSLFYFFSVYFIAEKNFQAFAGTTVGSMIIIFYLAEKNRRKRVHTEENKGSE